MVVISWIKTYTSANDGEILGGQNLGDMQTAIETHSHTDLPASFLALNDVPATYLGQAGRFLRVNVTENGLEFTTGGGGSASSYTVAFTSSSLVAGILTITHNLGIKYVVVAVYDNTDKQIIPDEVNVLGLTSLTIDLSSYVARMVGTWNVRVVA